jgi:hypothetical protein
MNNDSDYIRNLLLWLLYEFDPTFSLPSGNGSTSKARLKVSSSEVRLRVTPKVRQEISSELYSAEASVFEVGSDATSMKPTHQKGSEEASSYPSTSSSASLVGALHPRFSVASREAFSQSWRPRGVTFAGADSQTAQSFNFGEIHAVQERFQALLKQRLLLEYENRPPLFPWESELKEYPAEVRDASPVIAISSLWSAHMGALKVPGLLPVSLMNTLLERCQEIARSPIKQGIRLVRAVEDLFPESADMLEPIANMVLVPAYRSSQATQDAVIQELANAAGGYGSALPEQQIALSMLAAQEILGALTFSVGSDKPCEQRSWITALGALELTVCYECSDEKADGLTSSGVTSTELPRTDLPRRELKVLAVLPDGGQVRLCDGSVEKLAARSQPGPLDLALANPVVGKTYVMEVSLQAEVHSLNFAIHIDDAHA